VKENNEAQNRPGPRREVPLPRPLFLKEGTFDTRQKRGKRRGSGGGGGGGERAKRDVYGSERGESKKKRGEDTGRGGREW